MLSAYNAIMLSCYLGLKWCPVLYHPKGFRIDPSEMAPMLINTAYLGEKIEDIEEEVQGLPLPMRTAK
jgi:hypothetical protein